MKETFIQHKTFEKNELPIKGEYENCQFKSCNFSESNLSDFKFIACTFNSFGLSFSFDSCQLNHSSFYKTKIKKTLFKNSQLQGIDFTEADLTSAAFDNCDFLQAIFDLSILEKADFRTAFNYTINPEKNRIKKAKFSVLGLSGLLDNYDIEIEK